MDRIHIGQVFRAIRREQHWRQIDVAKRAGVSQQTVSDVERGLFGRLSVDAYCRVAGAIGAIVPLMPQWRGPKLARLLDRRHAAMQNSVSEMLVSAGWTIAGEETFNDYGDRGSVDVLGWRQDARALLIVEIKSEIDSLEETLRRLKLKMRVVPGHVRRELQWRPVILGAVLVLPDGSTHRDLIAAHDSLVSACLPERTIAVRRWVDTPNGDMRGVLFLRNTDGGGTPGKPPSPDRIRRPKSGS